MTRAAPPCGARRDRADSFRPSTSKEARRWPNLIAIAYPDAATAEQVRAELSRASKEYLVELHDAVVVERDADGKIKLRQAYSTAGMGAAGGAMWGGLIGLLFLAPFLGMAAPRRARCSGR